MAQPRSSLPTASFTALPLASRNDTWAAVSCRLRSIMRYLWYGGAVVKFKPLLDRWKQDAAPVRTAKEYAIRLELDDASRLHALAELFPGQPLEAIITDLLHAGLGEIG